MHQVAAMDPVEGRAWEGPFQVGQRSDVPPRTRAAEADQGVVSVGREEKDLGELHHFEGAVREMEKESHRWMERDVRRER